MGYAQALQLDQGHLLSMGLGQEIIIRAPGRVCLFGDHQDYLGLPIIACAIDRFVEIRGTPNTTEAFNIEMPDIYASRNFSIHEQFGKSEKGDFIASALEVAKHYGCVPTKGYDIVIEGDVPINAGLSSSSSLVVAWVRFLLEVCEFTETITEELIAQISYEAEVVEQNSPGGRMDQYTIALGDIIFLRTDNTASYEKIDCDLKVLIIGESGIPKNTMGVLGDLREKAIRAVDTIREKVPGFNLKASTISDIDNYSPLLSEELRPYFQAAVENFSITRKALAAMQQEQPDLPEIGKLMTQHHLVLKDKLQITTTEIDAMIAAAMQAGALGAKIVGSGGGGSICALASEENEQAVIDAMLDAGAKTAYAVNISSGVKIVEQ